MLWFLVIQSYCYSFSRSSSSRRPQTPWKRDPTTITPVAATPDAAAPVAAVPSTGWKPRAQRGRRCQGRMLGSNTCPRLRSLGRVRGGGIYTASAAPAPAGPAPDHRGICDGSHLLPGEFGYCSGKVSWEVAFPLPCPVPLSRPLPSAASECATGGRLSTMQLLDNQHRPDSALDSQAQYPRLI